MNHEQRELAFLDSPQFAYNPEAQQIAVKEAQAKGLLTQSIEYHWPSEILK